MPPLSNTRHEAFAQALAKGSTATAAYVSAGYRPDDSHAARLARNGRIMARVAEIQGKAAAKVEATIERWTKEVMGIAFADIRDVLEFGPRCVKLKDGATLTAEQAALISEIAETRGGVRIKLHSKLDALEKLARRFGWYSPEKHELTGKNGGPIQTEDVNARDVISSRIAGIAARTGETGGPGKPH